MLSPLQTEHLLMAGRIPLETCVSVKGDREDSALGEEQGDSDGVREPGGCSQSPQERTTLLRAAEQSGAFRLWRFVTLVVVDRYTLKSV